MNNNNLAVIIDTEGNPVAELAAAVKIENDWIGFHLLLCHSYREMRKDQWSRYNIHGIDMATSSFYGYTREEAKEKFINWLKQMIAASNAQQITFYAPQDNRAEVKLIEDWQLRDELELPINYDTVPLGTWAQRSFKLSHRAAKIAKDTHAPVLKCFGCPYHTVYKPFYRTNNLNKLQHGYHCSLYDVYEACCEYDVMLL